MQVLQQQTGAARSPGHVVKPAHQGGIDYPMSPLQHSLPFIYSLTIIYEMHGIHPIWNSRFSDKRSIEVDVFKSTVYLMQHDLKWACNLTRVLNEECSIYQF